MANTRNAHVRKASSKRRSDEVTSEEAKRLLDDPAFQRGFENVRNGLIRLLEEMQHDGSTEMKRYEREITRSLRTLNRLKRTIALGVQGQQLRLADFKPQKPED
jgi:hypothetical protein